MTEIDDLVDDIEAHQELESLERKVGGKRRLTLEEIDRLPLLELSIDDEKVIRDNREESLRILQQKYGYEF